MDIFEQSVTVCSDGLCTTACTAVTLSCQVSLRDVALEYPKVGVVSSRLIVNLQHKVPVEHQATQIHGRDRRWLLVTFHLGLVIHSVRHCSARRVPLVLCGAGCLSALPETVFVLSIDKPV